MTREINRLRLKPYKIIYKNQQLHGEKSNELKERENLYLLKIYKLTLLQCIVKYFVFTQLARFLNSNE